MELSLEDLKRALDEPGRTADVCSTLLGAWFENISRRLGDALSAKGSEGSESRAAVDAVARSIPHLDSSARRRLLGSPWVSGFLGNPSGVAYENENGESISTIHALLLAVLAENPDRQHHCGSSELSDHSPHESALGDWTLKHHRGGTERVQRPRLGGVIVLDGDSRLSRRYEAESGTFCRPCLDISQKEMDAIGEKLEAAIHMLDEAAPHLGLLVRTFTRRVLVRKSIEEGEDVALLNLGSEYRPIHAGCIRMLNVHRTEMTVDLCAEAILHESVHSFLSAYEDVYGKFMSGSIRVRPVSPWSGNFIPNHSLAHAVFVYYAIHQLLDHVRRCRSTFDPIMLKRMKRRLMHVDGGFFIERRMSALFLLDFPASAEFMGLVDNVQSVIKRIDRPSADGEIAEDLT